MKKLLLVFVAVMGLAFAANAQHTGNAIGIRFNGGSHAIGGEISWQTPLAGNRLELDLGWANRDFFSLTGIYEWCGPIGGQFGWFVGPGVNLGFCINHGFGAAIVAEGGIEWNPPAVPLQFTLDLRPSFDFIKREDCAYNGFAFGGGFGIRYRF